MGTRANYRNLLSDDRWKQRRMEIMRRDGYRCRRCGARGKLNVHHRWYVYGRQPWQYPNRCLVTLCERCHRRTHLMRHLRIILITALLLAAAYLLKNISF